MKFNYNRNKIELLRVMKSKGEKKNLKVIQHQDKIKISLEPGKFLEGEDAIPVTFQGKITESEGECFLCGNYRYGFNLTTLVFVAALLIIARFVWSASQNQTDNMILCAIVSGLLIIVICIVWVKSKPAKKIINDFLSNLNVK